MGRTGSHRLPCSQVPSILFITLSSSREIREVCPPNWGVLVHILNLSRRAVNLGKERYSAFHRPIAWTGRVFSGEQDRGHNLLQIGMLARGVPGLLECYRAGRFRRNVKTETKGPYVQIV